MNPIPFLLTLRRAMLALAFGLLAGAAAAAPGAHGPNGEHLDAPQAGMAAGSSAPRLDAKSELFELVARLDGGELSILIDSFASNEPVLGASVEIESGSLKAKAKFHADLGDYAVDDPAMLKLLSAPGEHPVVITILAGEQTDLLDGVLRVGAGQVREAGHGHSHGDALDDDHGHAHGISWWRWALGAFIVLVFAISWKWRNKTRGDAVARKLGGGQA
jgi:hypothetical protein